MAAQDKEDGEEEALIDANVRLFVVLKRLSPPWPRKAKPISIHTFLILLERTLGVEF